MRYVYTYCTLNIVPLPPRAVCLLSPQRSPWPWQPSITTMTQEPPPPNPSSPLLPPPPAPVGNPALPAEANDQDGDSRPVFFFDIDNCLYPRSYKIHDMMGVLIHKYFVNHLGMVFLFFSFLFFSFLLFYFILFYFYFIFLTSPPACPANPAAQTKQRSANPMRPLCTSGTTPSTGLL